MSPCMATFLETACLLADRASVMAREAWFSTSEVSFKPDGSALTRSDLDIERELRDLLAERHPDHALLGEEFGHSRTESRYKSRYTWVIDPIDGTRQFSVRLANFGILIALCDEESPILGIIDHPVSGARCVAATGMGTRFNGQRVHCRAPVPLSDTFVALANPASFDAATRPVFERLQKAGRMVVYDGGCLAYMALARGALDVCLNGPDLDSFDICALVPVVEEAGGVITLWDGRRPGLADKGPIVATSSASLHAEALECLRHSSA